MQLPITTLVVLGAHSQDGFQWLTARFPGAKLHARAIVMRRDGVELDAVLWAETLRCEAKLSGVRLSVGLAEERGQGLDAAIRQAASAYERAFTLGGDMCVSHSCLLNAA